jgi:phosphatidate cytidylyltransferase
MRQRIVTGLLFTLGVAALLIPGLKIVWFSMIFLIVVGILAAHEMIEALKFKGLRPSSAFVFTGIATFLFALLPQVAGRSAADTSNGPAWHNLTAGMALMVFAMLCVMSLNMILPLLSKGPERINSAAAGSLTIAYIAFPLGSSALLVFYIPDGWYWLVLALLTPWASDVFAYFTGSAIGRHHIVPRISPKKTIEGSLGGVAGSMVVMVLFFELVLRRLTGLEGNVILHIVLALAAGALLGITSQLGDWLASAIKRWCEIKDFGRLLPGHGGILDRFDSAFFTMPVTLLLAVAYWLIF